MGERVETVVDGCERELRRWILRGQVRPGERLPPERALAARLGVNRTTLRSALTRLTAARLVRVRQGSGYVVQDFCSYGGLELLPELAGDDASLARMSSDLLRVRRTLLSMALAELDPRKLDAGLVAREVARLRELAEGGGPSDEITEAEHRVTSALLCACPTQVFSLSFNSLCFAARSTPRLCDAMSADASAVVRVALALLRIAEEPSAEAAGAALRALEARDESVLARLAATPARAGATLSV